MSRLETLSLRIRMMIAVTLASLFAIPAVAETVDIGTEGADGPLAGMIDLMQSIMNFLTGPMGVFACAAMLIAGVLMWAFAPKEGALGTVLRGVAASVIVLNIPAWVVWLDSLS